MRRYAKDSQAGVQLDLERLCIRQTGRKPSPRRSTIAGNVHSIVHPDVIEIVAGIELEGPGRQAGEIPADAAPVCAAVNGLEHISQGTGELAHDGIGNLRVRWIDLNIGNRARKREILQSPGGAVIRRHECASGGRHVDRVQVSVRLADRVDVIGERSAQSSPRVAAVGRLPEMASAVEDVVAIGWIYDERRIEILGAAGVVRDAGDLACPRCAAVIGAAEEIRGPKACDRRLMIDPAQVRLAELDQTAITALDQGPAERGRVSRGAVVLTATEGNVDVRRMEPNALKLNGVQERGAAIQLRPAVRGRVVTEDATVVAVEEFAACIECGGVMINVRSHSARANADIGPVDS